MGSSSQQAGQSMCRSTSRDPRTAAVLSTRKQRLKNEHLQNKQGMWDLLHQPGTKDGLCNSPSGWYFPKQQKIGGIHSYVSTHHNLSTKVISYTLCPLYIMLKIELKPKYGKQTKLSIFYFPSFFFFTIKPKKQSETINSSELSSGSHYSKN